jgi:ATP/maltotriose-dependent transcriptional regulator MalT
VEGVEGVPQRGDSPATLDLLASLVDKSLVQRAGDESGSRFDMLETIREFALERLETSGEAEAVRRQHAAFVVRLVEDARDRIHGPDAPAVLDQLDAEHDNLRAALGWTIAAGETALALRLAHAAWRFWWVRSQLGQGRAWLERAMALPDRDHAAAALRPKAQVAAGYFARVQGDYARAISLGEEALERARRGDDAHTASAALHLLALVANDRGELAEAQSHLEASIAIDREVGYAHGVAFGLSNLGDVALARGQAGDAAALADEALAIWRARGDAWGVAWAAIGRAKIARVQGDVVRAAALIGEGLAECARLGDKEIAARGVSELAALADERGDLRLAARLYGSVVALREAIGAPVALTERIEHEAAVCAIRDRLPGADFVAAWEAGRTLTPAQAVAEAAALAGETSPPGDAGTSPVYHLTPREREVLRLLVGGATDKEIGAALSISRHTVSKHVAAILAKLGVDSRTAAAATAIREGWGEGVGRGHRT